MFIYSMVIRDWLFIIEETILAQSFKPNLLKILSVNTLKNLEQPSSLDTTGLGFHFQSTVKGHT